MSTFAIGQAAVGLVTLTWLLIVTFFFSSERQPGLRAILRYRASVDADLRFLRLRYSGSRIVWFQFSVALFALGMAVASGSPIPLSLMIIGLLGPKLFIKRAVAQRIGQLEQQVEPWLNAIANALKASPSLGEAIASSAPLLPNPMCQEVELTMKEYELGTSLDRALEQFVERVGSRTLSGAIMALQVARNSGGNLPETLENAAAALRELARLEGVVRTKTAEGKAQAFVIGVIPIPMVVGIRLMDEHFFDPLMSTFMGHVVIGTAALLWGAAVLLAMRILAVDI